MLHRIRLAMKNKSVLKIGTTGAPVEIDETWVGGKVKNNHSYDCLSSPYVPSPSHPPSATLACFGPST